MKTQVEIDTAKSTFFRQHADNTPDYYGVIAAVQHGRLYSPNVNTRRIRATWQYLLRELSTKYIETQQTQETFIADILALKECMNCFYPDAFNNGSNEYENGFRIAHAQKSLSICLKHMWCRGILKFIPPVCPIDGIILRSLGCNEAWTKVNRIDDNNTFLYRHHLDIVNAQMTRENFSTLAEWELFYWPMAINARNGNQDANSRQNVQNSPIIDRCSQLLSQSFPNYRLLTECPEIISRSLKSI